MQSISYTLKLTAIAAVAVVVSCTVGESSVPQQEWSFSGVDTIDLDGVSGDVVVRQGRGSEIRIMLDENVRPADAFRGTAEQRGSTIFVEEDWANLEQKNIAAKFILGIKGKEGISL